MWCFIVVCTTSALCMALVFGVRWPWLLLVAAAGALVGIFCYSLCQVASLSDISQDAVDND